MSETIRVSGKTVNDAILNAAIELNTTSDWIDYTVIEHESRGFLGLGAKDAVIEAKIREEAPSPEESGESRETVNPVHLSGKEIPSGSAAASGKTSDAAPEKEQKEASVQKNAEASVSDASADERKEEKQIRTNGDAHGKKNSDIRVLEDPSEAIERAETFLKDVFASMNMEVSITSDYDGECLNVSMEGGDMGLLIGKRGQTLDALQYLTSLVVNKGKPYYVRVKLDTENYRERRKATLENLAKNIAVKVKKTRQSVYLEPMNPYERRIIHSALQNDPFVTTHSEGEEPERKVVVTLKKDADLELLERKYGDRNRRGGYRGGRGGYGRGGRGGYSERSDRSSSYRRDREDTDRRPEGGENAE